MTIRQAKERKEKDAEQTVVSLQQLVWPNNRLRLIFLNSVLKNRKIRIYSGIA